MIRFESYARDRVCQNQDFRQEKPRPGEILFFNFETNNHMFGLDRKVGIVWSLPSTASSPLRSRISSSLLASLSFAAFLSARKTLISSRRAQSASRCARSCSHFSFFIVFSRAASHTSTMCVDALQKTQNTHVSRRCLSFGYFSCEKDS